MITKKDLKALFHTSNITVYWDYIVESYINGNHSQVTELFNDLNKLQKKAFMLHLIQLIKEHSTPGALEILEKCIGLI